MKKHGLKRYEVPADAYRLAQRRTEFLCTVAFDKSPHELAMMAYLQGIRDAASVMYDK